MEIILLIFLLVMVGLNFYLLYRGWEQIQKPKEVKKEPKLTKEEKEKQKKIKQSFENMMNYDETIARSRK